MFDYLAILTKTVQLSMIIQKLCLKEGICGVM